jgi:hypothetical protein
MPARTLSRKFQSIVALSRTLLIGLEVLELRRVPEPRSPLRSFERSDEVLNFHVIP